jgi:hypothetical protein
MAYTDPTFLSRQGPTDLINAVLAAPIVTPGRAIGLWPCLPPGCAPVIPGQTSCPRPILVAMQAHNQVHTIYGERIPSPPMGQQVVLLLPAVYGRGGLPLKGQRYPLSR